MPADGEVTTVIGTLPVAETFGFSNDIRAASQVERFGILKILDLMSYRHNYSTRSSAQLDKEGLEETPQMKHITRIELEFVSIVNLSRITSTSQSVKGLWPATKPILFEVVIFSIWVRED